MASIIPRADPDSPEFQQHLETCEMRFREHRAEGDPGCFNFACFCDGFWSGYAVAKAEETGRHNERRTEQCEACYSRHTDH